MALDFAKDYCKRCKYKNSMHDAKEIPDLKKNKNIASNKC